MTKFSKKILCVGLMSLCFVSSLSAAGIDGGRFPASQSPEEETRQWRQEILSTLKNVEVSCQERVRFEDEKIEVFRLLVKHFKKSSETRRSD